MVDNQNSGFYAPKLIVPQFYWNVEEREILDIGHYMYPPFLRYDPARHGITVTPTNPTMRDITMSLYTDEGLAPSKLLPLQ
jgi:hypothetical protein